MIERTEMYANSRRSVWMFNINWLNIRAFNNSQNSAFEELVCQLASEEEIPGKVGFTRVGAPDGGVEAYCTLEDHSEYGWQAKYFFSMGDNQWIQLEKSLRRAIDTHPKLVKYYICIPLDRQDPRNVEQQWFMDKWNTKTKEWQAYALSLGRVIKFEYWGSSELLSKLAQEKNAGRTYFWFNKDEFSDEWFTEQLQANIDSLGGRYTPELNFELDIAKHFDGLARNEKFQSRLTSLQHNFMIKVEKLNPSIREEVLSDYKNSIQMLSQRILETYKKIAFIGAHKNNYSELLESLDQLRLSISDCRSFQHDLRHRKKTDNNLLHTKEIYDNIAYDLRQVESAVEDYYDFLTSPAAVLSNTPFLLIKGEAGIGKSHLLADVCRNRQNSGELSLLLLGQHFVSEENPWTQIINNLLRLQCTSESEFLGALNAKAESIGSRIVIFIDAINEGKGKYIWREYLRNFIRKIEKYKWLGLVISIRTSYEKLLANESILPKDMVVRVKHSGFSDVEYAASKQFFQYYQIQQPSIPLLHPEFYNPLFLKLFCEGLNKGGHKTIPDGYEGITAIIGFFMLGINTRLSDAKRLDFPDKINLVEKAVKLIMQMKAETDQRFLSYEDVHIKLEALAKQYGAKGQLLEALISEGLLSCNLFWTDQRKYEDGIYFTYERFEDHLTANFLLEQYMNKNFPEKSFNQGNKLFEFVKDKHACSLNKGILEAFSVQLPEKFGMELYELAPDASAHYPFVESFIESLPWRKTETITPKLTDYIDKYVMRYEDTHDLFLDTLLLLTSRPKHYFNAEFLHNHLLRFSLADRDAWWTIYIHQQYDEQTPVKRLIDWAWNDENKQHISDESVLLSATTLSWFLASSNRFLRDSATKALVNLLQNRSKILLQLLKKFRKVNDPYVLERLYAVAYGCSLRTTDISSLSELSEYIYSEVFDKDLVYSHILLRDYARGVIEYTLHLGFIPLIDDKKIRPPYKSEWYEAIPTKQDIETLKINYKSNDCKDYYWSQNAILNSMRTGRSSMYGDFGRYVFQSGFRPWSDLDPEVLSHIAIKRIFDLGYDVQKHGEFDRNAQKSSYVGRGGRKPERIGKKYQWIAFYELLAKVSDHYLLHDDSSWEQKKRKNYCGPWDPYVRDIDPTMLIANTGDDKYESSASWWFDTSYNNWNLPNHTWVHQNDDLPDPKNMLIVKDNTEEEWIVLESYPEWTEPEKLGQEKWDYPQKHLWYQLRSYLVPINRYKQFFNWASDQHFMGRWMPESESEYKMFSREYYWSPAFKFLQHPYYGGSEWQKVSDQNGEGKGNVMVTTLNFLWEETYDCSKTDSISYLKPCKSIFTGMKMKLSSREGELLNERNQIICLDPSVNHKSLSCLLVRKKEFINYLQENKLRIVWTMLGEKQIIGDDNNHQDTKWLEFSGAYLYDMSKEVIQGDIHKVLKNPGSF